MSTTPTPGRDGKVTAYVIATGRMQRVPAHYIDHPVLGRGLTTTPLTEPDAAFPEGTPTDEWSTAQLDAYADHVGIDLAGAKASKADRVERLTAPPEPTRVPEEPIAPADPITSDVPASVGTTTITDTPA